MKNINKGKKKFLVPLIATLFLITTIYSIERAESSEYKPPDIPMPGSPVTPDIGSSIPGIPDSYEKGDVLMLELPGDWKENWAKPGGKGKYDMPPDGVINDHAAIYMGRDYKPPSFNSDLFDQYDWEYYSRTEGVWFISALATNVCYNTIDYFIDVPDYDDKITTRSWEYRYGHVVDNFGQDAIQPIKDSAADWAVGKRGDEYQVVFEDGWIKHADYKIPQSLYPNSYKWYCMELVWAAYINEGIDIDFDGGLGVSGNDILADDNYENYPDCNHHNLLVKFVEQFPLLYQLLQRFLQL